jgi:hypothetical protein
MRRVFGTVSSCGGARGILGALTGCVDRALDTKRLVPIAFPLHGGWTSEANCCTTELACGGAAEFASRLIGKREVIRQHISHTRPTSLGGSAHETRTTSDHHTTEDAVMASEIEQLPDPARFLELASSPSWRRVSIART